MICGFDAVEEVAVKARRFLANLSRQSNFDGCLAISLLTETVMVLKTTLENGLYRALDRRDRLQANRVEVKA